MTFADISRRTFLTGAARLGAVAFAGAGVPFMGMARAQQVVSGSGGLHRKIPASGETIPAIGLGSWITFNVGNDPVLLKNCADVMGAFFAGGGKMIDSSPMYGSSQATIGHGLAALGIARDQVFATDKVWTGDENGGAEQIAQSAKNWGISRFDLLQVHNMLDWEDQLPMLQAKKAAGELGYIGVTTSHQRRHELLSVIMQREPLDFIQVTYNPLDRAVENRILPMAQERGIAVIINRPFRGGHLTKALRGKALPGFAGDYGAQSWAQLILKYIISHPAVTCAIPATTKVDHVRENLAAAMPDKGGNAGKTDILPDILPDEKMRHAIANAIGDAL
ncbi:aldo/keto reductase [Thalassospira mesophila]|uniref:Aldo/keto reductase n=1 Tax=Thalassospira mesophila TaxID=1293891 RepID=A0A1Y2L2T0_9PROT|nr:aldo/keto reductase [Thalassospira mesophila]OSQ39645.1 aldo/keto reductase [Thalassospira mesophila]